MYIHIYICINIQICVHIYIFMYIYICEHIYIYIYTCVYISNYHAQSPRHTHTHAHTHTHTHIHKHTHTYSPTGVSNELFRRIQSLMQLYVDPICRQMKCLEPAICAPLQAARILTYDPRTIYLLPLCVICMYVYMCIGIYIHKYASCTRYL